MSNFFKRLTDVATGEKKNHSPKPALTPEILSGYFQISNGLSAYPSSLLEDSQSSYMTQFRRFNNKNDETDDQRVTLQAHDQTRAKSSFSNRPGAKIDATSTSVSMSQGTDYFSDIIGSAGGEGPIWHDMKSKKSSSAAADQRSYSSYENSIDRRIAEVDESHRNSGHNPPDNNNNSRLRRDLIPDFTGESYQLLHALPNTSDYYYSQSKKIRSADLKNSEHVVTINIGRIEILASKEEKRFQRRVGKDQQQKFPPVSLSEYLQKRSDAKQ